MTPRENLAAARDLHLERRRDVHQAHVHHPISLSFTWSSGICVAKNAFSVWNYSIQMGAYIFLLSHARRSLKEQEISYLHQSLLIEFSRDT